MATWVSLSEEQPELAAAGRDLLYQHGVGLAFLATVRRDGGPRLHPMCPLLVPAGLFAFIIPSPKQQDLLRDPRYSMHSFPCPDGEDAFYISGRAAPCEDNGMRGAVSRQFLEERSSFGPPPPAEADLLFEFHLETVLLTRTAGHGDADPRHSTWHAR